MSINEYLKRYIIVGSILTIVVSVLFSLGFPNTTSTPLIIAPILFTVVSIGTLKLLAMPALSAVLKFSNAFMLTNVGKISVEETLVLQETACVHGDIITDKLVVENGAIFTGTCNMDAKGQAASTTN